MTTGAGYAGAGVPTPTAHEHAPGDARHAGRRRAAAIASLGLGLVTTVLVVGGFALGVHTSNLHNGLIAAAFTAVGVFVVRRRPGNREAWLFIATGVTHAAMFFARQYGLYEPATLPAQSWLGWLGVWPLGLVIVLAGVTLMCFPDGRLPSPRWRLVVIAMVLLGALASTFSALWPVEFPSMGMPVPHPLDLGGSDAAARLWTVIEPGYLLLQIVWMTCVVVRLRQARGDERRQLKWFAYAVTMGAAAMVLGLVAFGSPTVGVLAVPLVPVVAGVAIVKYRLYDIDLVISKTLAIGTMAGLVTAAYIGAVFGVGRLVGTSTDPGSVLSLVATAVVAVAFEPVRRRVQQGADRLVYGHRPTPYEALARLSTQLSRGSQGADLLTDLASTVADGVGARDVTLWVGSADKLVAVATWPPRQGTESPLATAPHGLDSLADDARTHVRPIVHQRVLRGAITVTKAPGEVLTGSEDRLLRDLVAQAGLVIDNADLGAELQDRLHQIAVQAGELRAAAKRIVAAQYEARRRIERDLHDGAQQRLVTLALSLRSISERAAAAGHSDLVAAVEEAQRELSQGLGELREMARGIHPAILTQEGLEAALSFLAERSPVPVRVRVGLDRRLAEDVEATAYFVVSEALTNAAKHSGASRIDVEGGLDGGELRIEVSDDGRGGADGHWGSGLQGLADRVATLNGRLTVVSTVGHGTRLRAEIPCG